MSPESNPVVTIDCKDEGWDNVLYDSLWKAEPIELRNLHSSYEPFMKQLAEMSSREFILHGAEYRGEFTRRSRT
jgi:hypothetical protein